MEKHDETTAENREGAAQAGTATDAASQEITAMDLKERLKRDWAEMKVRRDREAEEAARKEREEENRRAKTDRDMARILIQQKTGIELPDESEAGEHNLRFAGVDFFLSYGHPVGNVRCCVEECENFFALTSHHPILEAGDIGGLILLAEKNPFCYFHETRGNLSNTVYGGDPPPDYDPFEEGAAKAEAAR